MHHVQIGDIARELPATWDELTRKQLIQVSSLFNRNITVVDFKIRLLFRFLHIKTRLWKKITPEDMHGLAHSLDYLLEKVTLTRALVRSIRIRRFPWTKLYGPQDKMGTSDFGEFTKAHVRYESYQRTKDETALNELVAILFRPKKPFWFIRRHFSETTDPRARFLDRTLPLRAKRVSTLPFAVKYAVFLFFSGVYASLPDRFPNVYKAKPSSSSDKNGGWASLIISLADGKTDDQSLERIMNSNLYNVFMGLEQKSIEYFDFLKKYPQND